MNPQVKKFSIPALRWTLGLVVLWESANFIFSESAARHIARAGLPPWIRPALGGIEVVAALLFLAPVTGRVGGYMLLVIFAIAALLHLLHGEDDVSGLLLYGVAAIVCMAHGDEQASEARHDG